MSENDYLSFQFKNQNFFMKQLTSAAFLLCVLVACNNATTSTNTKDSTAGDTTSSNQSITYAYPVEYASDFSIGNPKHSQSVLTLWKDYDNNTMDAHKDLFADSIEFVSSGSDIKGSKDSVIKAISAYRNSFSSAVSSVSVVVSLKPKGKDESWVSIWGKEVDTHKNGKADSIYLNENWMFNKDEKISYIEQLQEQPQKKKL